MPLCREILFLWSRNPKVAEKPTIGAVLGNYEVCPCAGWFSQTLVWGKQSVWLSACRKGSGQLPRPTGRIMHKSGKPRPCERGAGIRAGVNSLRPGSIVRQCRANFLTNARTFETVVHNASGGQFCPGIDPKGSENRIPIEPQQLFRGSRTKINQILSLWR